VIAPSAPAGPRAAGVGAPDGSPADSEKLHEAVSEHFKANKDYQPGDLITRGDVTKLGDVLKKLGGVPEDWQEILDDVLPDGDELVRALRTPRGRSFMRKVASQPGGYDRLDQLRSLPQGSRRVRELIEAPGGEKLIEYLATTKGGRSLGKQLARSKGGRGFDDPTGRIYTEADLLTRLEASYQQQSGKAPASRPGAGGKAQ
jgi:hypothetical protein